MQKTILAQLSLARIVLAVAFILGLVITYKLWLTSGRFFPHTPVFPFLPQIPYPVDLAVFGAAIVLLLLIAYGYRTRKLITAFCTLFLVLMLLDQNRWQPWAFQYFCMMCALAFIDWHRNDPKREENIFIALRLIICGIYLYSGLQKLNPKFFEDTYPWLLEPLAPILSENAYAFMLKIGYLFPAIEIFMGSGLLFSRTRKVAIVFAVVMHTLILIDMSPLGHDYNYVILPWNIAMIFLVILLYDRTIPFESYKRSLRYKPAFVMLLLFWVLPFLSFFNRWDSYLSASLYSGNTSSGVLYLSDKVKAKLPPGIRQHVKASEGQNQLGIKYWSMMEMGVPGYPEKRVFINVKNSFYKYSEEPGDVLLLYTERASLLGPEKSEVVE